MWNLLVLFLNLDLWLFVDIYWKNEHRLMCTSEVCTAAERDRYEKSVSIFYGCQDGLIGEFIFCIVNCGHRVCLYFI